LKQDSKLITVDIGCRKTLSYVVERLHTYLLPAAYLVVFTFYTYVQKQTTFRSIAATRNITYDTNSFEFFWLYSPAEHIKVSCAGLL
jgi:hypothetical protein